MKQKLFKFRAGPIWRIGEHFLRWRKSKWAHKEDIIASLVNWETHLTIFKLYDISIIFHFFYVRNKHKINANMEDTTLDKVLVDFSFQLLGKILLVFINLMNTCRFLYPKSHRKTTVRWKVLVGLNYSKSKPWKWAHDAKNTMKNVGGFDKNAPERRTQQGTDPEPIRLLEPLARL